MIAVPIHAIRNFCPVAEFSGKRRRSFEISDSSANQIGRVKAVLAAALGAGLLAAALTLPMGAQADPPTKTDVMFLFDTTASMQHALHEASAEVDAAMAQIDTQLPDVQYGLSQVRDDGGSVYDPKSPEDVPWELVDPISPNTEAVVDSIAGLSAHGGGDLPEAYGRALWEVATNPTVGWRPGAARLVLLIADNVPHDANLDEGIPESDWVEAPPWDTGDELDEPAGVVGTQLNGSTNLDWQSVLAQLAAAGIKLEVIAYHGESGYLPYWENWAARTGGQAILGESHGLAGELTGLVETGAPRPCGSVRGSIGKKLLASLRCSAALLPLKEACGAKLSIAKALRILAETEVTIGEHRPKKSGPVAGLLTAVRAARFLRHAPHGFTSSDEVVGRLEHPQTSIALIRLLPRISKAVQRPSFERIAVSMADLPPAKPCATGLLAAVE